MVFYLGLLVCKVLISLLSALFGVVSNYLRMSDWRVALSFWCLFSSRGAGAANSMLPFSGCALL